MPKVEQLDWSTLKPPTPEKGILKGTKEFSTYECREKRKNSKHGAIKTTKLPKVYRAQYGRDMNHIRSIMREE